MMRKNWATKAKLLAETAVMSGFLVFLSTGAQANYSYTFTISPSNLSMIAPISGSFTTGTVLSANGSISLNSYAYSYTYAGILYSGSSTGSSGAGSINLGSVISLPLGLASTGISLSSGSGFTVNGNKISGNVVVSEKVSVGVASINVLGSGFFEAMLTSSSGGGSGGGGGGSGGAPSPEVNASLGMILAGATFAFLRRRRGYRLAAAAR